MESAAAATISPARRSRDRADAIDSTHYFAAAGPRSARYVRAQSSNSPRNSSRCTRAELPYLRPIASSRAELRAARRIMATKGGEADDLEVRTMHVFVSRALLRRESGKCLYRWA